MRLTTTFILATLFCLSLSSCSFLRGGSNTDLEEHEGQAGGTVETPVTVAEETVDEQPIDAVPSAETVEPLQLTTLYSTASLNVRAGRGTSHPVVAGLSYGDAVAAGRLEDGWYELFDNDRRIGFAHSGYLSREKPAPRIRSGVPSASLETGLFGVSLPVGASLVESTPLTVDTDAMETYRVPMANEEIRSFYMHELTSLGWKPDKTATETTLKYRKGDLMISVVLNENGQRFTLTGGQR